MDRGTIFKAMLATCMVIDIGADAADDQVVDEARPGFEPRHRVITRAQFDQIVYGQNVDQYRQKIDAQVKQKVRELNKKYELTDADLQKLELAARVDKRRLLKEIDALDKRFQALSENENPDQQPKFGIRMHPEVNNIIRDGQLLKRKQTDFLGNGSFFEKASKTILASSSLKSASYSDSDPIFRRHRTHVEAAIQAVEKQAKINVSQRESLTNLLLKEARPTGVARDFDEVVVKYQFARLPDEKLKPFFNDKEWPAARRVLDDFLEFGPALEHNGLIRNVGSNVKVLDLKAREPGPRPAAALVAPRDNRAVVHVPDHVAMQRPGDKSREIVLVDSSSLLSRHRANLDAAVRLFERQFEMEPGQREQLFELLFREIPAPNSIGDYDDVMVQYRMSCLPESKLKRLFSEEQWQRVPRVLERAGLFKPVLIERGLIVERRAPTGHATQTDVAADASSPVNELADAIAPANREGD